MSLWCTVGNKFGAIPYRRTAVRSTNEMASPEPKLKNIGRVKKKSNRAYFFKPPSAGRGLKKISVIEASVLAPDVMMGSRGPAPGARPCPGPPRAGLRVNRGQ